jgi:hypothetical protein
MRMNKHKGGRGISNGHRLGAGGRNKGRGKGRKMKRGGRR